MVSKTALIKISDYLLKREEAVSPWQICRDISLNSRSAKNCLEILDYLEKIEMVRGESGRSLVKWKK